MEKTIRLERLCGPGRECPGHSDGAIWIHVPCGTEPRWEKDNPGDPLWYGCHKEGCAEDFDEKSPAWQFVDPDTGEPCGLTYCPEE
jgi:hypothetical protein